MQFQVDIQKPHLLKPNENCMSITMSVSEPELEYFTNILQKALTNCHAEKKVKAIEAVTPMRPCP